MKNFINSSYRYDKFIFQIHQEVVSMSSSKNIAREEVRRLLLIDEFIKLVAHADKINYDNCNMLMRLSFIKKKGDDK